MWILAAVRSCFRSDELNRLHVLVDVLFVIESGRARREGGCAARATGSEPSDTALSGTMPVVVTWHRVEYGMASVNGTKGPSYLAHAGRCEPQLHHPMLKLTQVEPPPSSASGGPGARSKVQGVHPRGPRVLGFGLQRRRAGAEARLCSRRGVRGGGQQAARPEVRLLREKILDGTLEDAQCNSKVVEAR
jgi:hypothetical protein